MGVAIAIGRGKGGVRVVDAGVNHADDDALAAGGKQIAGVTIPDLGCANVGGTDFGIQLAFYIAVNGLHLGQLRNFRRFRRGESHRKAVEDRKVLEGHFDRAPERTLYGGERL
ncbi:MAG: hypothetical protein BWY63_03820 [Chloroflexi bacterium ADurb.Bin360]|nr:MAG: hypothetical protein BWY63_03820 [Chloroflexi bacterium ADurb.Bin360]